MRIIQSIDFGIFPGFCLFAYNYSYDELIKALNKKPENGWAKAISTDRELIEGGSYFALRRTLVHPKHREKDYFYIIITEEFKFTGDEVCKLAHECLHICQFYLPAILDRDREREAEAYFHTHIMKQCLKAMHKCHKRKK